MKPKAEMNADLVAHVRYPEDLFKVQRLVYSRYHVTDPGAFYNGQGTSGSSRTIRRIGSPTSTSRRTT